MRLVGTAAILTCVFTAAACGGSSSSDPSSGGSSGAGATGGATGGSAGSGATGGAAGGSGGSAAAGGSAGTGMGGGAGAECASSADCQIYSDCCICEATAKGEPSPPMCDRACKVDRCTELGAKGAACIAGRCVAQIPCDASGVTCKSLPPMCPAGQVPAVDPIGNCWGGGCVEATECARVTDCSACTGPDTACAACETQLGIEAHCVSVPAACNGDSSCKCLGPSVCLNGFNLCNDFSGIKGVSCGCPTC